MPDEIPAVTPPASLPTRASGIHHPILGLAVLLIWGAWFGGMIALVFFVSTLFAQDRPLGMMAAPRLFHAFEPVQLALAILLLALVLIWLLLDRSQIAAALFCSCAVAGVGAWIAARVITPHIDALHAAGYTPSGLLASRAFAEWHRRSEHVYGAIALALLLMGVLIPSIFRCREK